MLKALEAYKYNSKLIWNCKNIIKTLRTANNLPLTWESGHSLIFGNKEADTLANLGAVEQFQGSKVTFGITSMVVANQILGKPKQLP